jgi:hypothetical protein
MTTQIIHPKQDADPLTDEARARARKLFAEYETACAERNAIKAERALRAPGSDFSDLAEKERESRARWDDAIFALSLAVGDSPNEAASRTHAGMARTLRERASAAPSANVIPLRPHHVPQAPRGGVSLIGRPAPSYIKVNKLADELGQTTNATRRLLDRGLIPGARRITPGLANSPWLIPPNAAEEYLATHTKGAT